MVYSELSENTKKRIRKCVCAICLQPFTEVDSIQYLKYRQGKFMNYSFFHSDCLAKARKEINERRA